MTAPEISRGWEALEPCPCCGAPRAPTGEMVVPVRTFVDVFVEAQASWLEGENMKPVANMLRGLLSDLRVAEAALAALPPSSGWEAGAEAVKTAAEALLRQRSKDTEHVANLYTEPLVRTAYRSKAEVLWAAANAVMDMPLPPPPSREGV